MILRLMTTTLLSLALAACAHDTWTGSQNVTQQELMDEQEPDLTAYHWQLERAVDARGATDVGWLRPADQPVTLNFDERNVTVGGLCNILNAGYVAEGSTMRIGQVAGTMRMCPDDAMMRYEQAIGVRLPQVTSWHITHVAQQAGQPRLTLRFVDDAQWVLTGNPTAQTRYGSQGDIMFLEIAPHAVPCSDPLIPQRQCLNVRTVHYDATGVKQDYGAWQPFYGSIDGYVHEPGVRNIVRVKRYTRDNPPADLSRYAYVLDMVVESEAAGPLR